MRFDAGLFRFKRLIGSVLSRFNTEYDLEELLKFGEGRHFVSASRTYEQSVEKTKANIKWMKANAVAVKEWQENVNCLDREWICLSRRKDCDVT
ncbi:aminopeptidase N-like [Anneissia japonica]|uniref:aminopeptidase N-like n=1 Tax=Anneissia japonica TaxID=1529436 RepID=UPI00142598B0|nr:aminopeptidase N-like [Anneissia japonica]